MAIMAMAMGPQMIFMHQGMGIELLYSFVIIISSLMIYHSTKEMYELTSHKGLKYFRAAFLFFAVAYFFRYSLRFLVLFFGVEDVFGFLLIHPLALLATGAVSTAVYLYSSFMAVFYLLYSIMWKKWNHSMMKVYMLHGLAVVLTLMVLLFRQIEMYLLVHILLLLFASFVLFAAYKDSKGKQKNKMNLYVIYQLLLIFLIINVIDILIPNFLQIYQTMIYLASILLFMIILYKVLKKTGN